MGTVGDNYDRFAVRLAEIYESVHIIEQALDGLPEGPYITEDRKVALPPRHELATSMEALIHHFKLVTEGFRVPPGEVYNPIESPRGELGCYVRSDGSSKPARVHMRDPVVRQPPGAGAHVPGQLHRRHDRHHRDARSDPGRDRPMSAAAGSRGWDVPADLDKDPATIPDPATTPVPEELRSEIESHMALYPDPRSAALPALEAAQRVHGWCSPEAIEQVACVMGVTPASLDAVATFYDMLETEPVGRHAIFVCTNISCSLRGADELYAAMRDAAGEDPAFNVRAFECLGACDIAPMASVDGVYVGPLQTEDVPRLLDDVRAGATRAGRKQLARQSRARTPRRVHEDPVRPHRRARAEHARGLRTPRRLRVAAQGACA